jgi:hypothetical protein
LDRGFAFPHAGAPIPMPGIAVGITRMAFFVARAHFGTQPALASPARTVVPRPFVGVFDRSVLAPGEDETEPTAALVGFSWLEHEAYKVRVLVPPRLRNLSDEDEADDLRRRVVQALQRFRPAGVDLEAAFIDDRFVLGEAVLRDAESDDPLDRLIGGTVLWASPDAA